MKKEITGWKRLIDFIENVIFMSILVIVSIGVII